MSAKVSVLVFAGLVGLTVAELTISSIQGSLTVTTLVGLAGAKALLIALFFQELKDEPRSLSSILLLGLVIASLLMTISFLQLHPVHL